MKKIFILLSLVWISTQAWSQIGITPETHNPDCDQTQSGYIILNAYGCFDNSCTYTWTGPEGNIEAFDEITELSAGTYSVTISDGVNTNFTQSFTLVDPPQISITIDSIKHACFGYNDGLINITATGGTGSLSFEWSNQNYSYTDEDIDSLYSGIYNVHIIDANECAFDSIDIVVNNVDFYVNVVTNSPSCYGVNNGRLDATVQTNESVEYPPYTYLWANGSTNDTLFGLSGFEDYELLNVTVTDANGCAAQGYGYFEGGNDPIRIEYDKILSNCGNDDGQIEITFIGYGWARQYDDFDVLWSNGDTGLVMNNVPAGMQSVLVTDITNGCNQTEYIFMEDNTSLEVEVYEVLPSCEQCNNGQISLGLINGEPPYTVEWNNGDISEYIGGLYPGNYSATITDGNGCQKSICYYLGNSYELYAYGTSNNTSDCGQSDGSAMVWAYDGVAPYTYLWSDPAAQTTQTATSLSSGLYFCTVTDQSSNTKIVTIIVYDSNSDVYFEFVNSTNAICNQGGGSVDLNIAGGTGNYTFLWSDGSTELDLTNVESGEYSVVADDGHCKTGGTFSVNSDWLQTQEICLVTVDSVTNHNLVVWEPNGQTGVEYYNIYRNECDGGSNFIGTVAADEITVFEDINSFPATHSYTYFLTAANSCDNQSNYSAPHKTIHLEVNVNETNNSVQLIWDDYIGFANPIFKLYRKTVSQGWQLLTEVPESQMSYIDPNFSDDVISYSIVVVKPDSPCDAWNGNQRASGGPYYQSTSNIEDEGIIDHTVVKTIKAKGLGVYPNPANAMVTISANAPIGICEIYDMQGKLVRSFQNIQKTEFHLNTNVLNAGVYTVKVFADEVYTQKLVVE